LRLLKLRPSRVDRLLAAVLVVVGAGAGAGYFRTVLADGGQPWFYQVDFGPAVMMACGHGFVVPDDTQLPALADFLNSRSPRFSCDALPPSPPLRTIVGAQPWLAWAHLIRLAGVVWWFSGVSWLGLAPLAGFFLGMTSGLAFVVLRLVSGPVLAAAATAALLVSPLLLAELPQFRDFSKVPFMFALAWLLAQLLAPSITARRLIAIAAGYGLVLALSIGFRNDALITIPPFVVLVAVARGADLSWRARLAGGALSLAVFLVAASPVLGVFRQGGGAFIAHAALLGMMSPLDDELGLRPPTLHEVGYGLTDTYAAAVISAAETRRAGTPVALLGHSPDYDTAAARYVLAAAATLPADIIARGYGAAIRAITLPSWALDPERPPHLSSPIVLRFYSLRARVLRLVWWIWPAAVAAALLVVSAREMRTAVILVVLTIYFTAYAAIQFHPRHIIHLELVPIAALAFIAHTVWSRDWRGSWRRAGVFAVATLLVIVVPLLAARFYQQRSLSALLQQYGDAPMASIRLAPAATEDSLIVMEDQSSDAAAWMEAHQDAVLTEYVIVDVGGEGCRGRDVELAVRYAGTAEAADFARHYVVRSEADSARVMIATFAYKQSAAAGGATWYRWRGFEVSQADLPCLGSVAKLRSPERFPVLLNAYLPGDWRSRALFARVGGW
jgi:hypothetical protein